MDRITLDSMRFESTIGATADERVFPQMLEIDLEVETDLSAASTSDSLADTVDYTQLVELTERVAEGGGFVLLEGLAGALATAALRISPGIAAVTVRVRKLAVPIDVSMEFAQVEVRRERADA